MSRSRPAARGPPLAARRPKRGCPPCLEQGGPEPKQQRSEHASVMRQLLEGIPFLQMEGDCIDEANLQVGPLRTRVRGFLEVLVMAGGVAKNRRAVKATGDEIGEALIVPSKPQIVGALGAALLAMDGLGATTR